MAETVQTFPDQFSITVQMTWGDRQVSMRTIWRRRPGAWYIDLFEADGTPIVFGRRMSPSFSPTNGFGFEGDQLPRDRQLFTVGPNDPYLQSALGTVLETDLLPLLVTDEEVAAAVAAEASPTFTTEIFLQ